MDLDLKNYQPEMVDVAKIVHPAWNPGSRHKDTSLADSIKADGLLMPVLLRPADDAFEVVHGIGQSAQLAVRSRILGRKRLSLPKKAQQFSMVRVHLHPTNEVGLQRPPHHRIEHLSRVRRIEP